MWLDRLIGFTLICSCCTFISPIEAREVRQARTVYKVDLTASREISIAMTVRWGGLSRLDFYPFEDFTCAVGAYEQPSMVSGGIGRPNANGSISVYPREGAQELQIRYSFSPISTSGDIPQNGFEECLPAIHTSEYFLVDSKRLFPFVKHFDDTGKRQRLGAADIIWQLPLGWEVADAEKDGDITISHISDATEVDDIYAGGAIRIRDKDRADGEGLRFFGSSTLFPKGHDVPDSINRAYRYFSEEFWPLDGKRSSNIFLLRTGAMDGQSLFGVARPGLAVVFVSADLEIEREAWRVEEIATHEVLHWWLPFAFTEQPGAIPLWVREGIVEYLAHRFVSHNRSYSTERVAGRLNKAISMVADDPTAVDPYELGFLSALSFYETEFASGSAIPEIRRIAKILRAARDQADAGELPDLAELFVSPATSRSFIFNGIPLPCTIRLGVGELVLKQAKLPNYDAGMDIAYSDHADAPIRVETVHPSGPAERAGLIAGDIIRTHVSGGNGNIHEKLVLEIENAAGQTRMVAFWPHGNTHVKTGLFYSDSNRPVSLPEESSLCPVSAS